MAEPRHYIWEKIESEKHQHYLMCENKGVPYIEVTMSEADTAVISYDSITMYKFSFRNDSKSNASDFDRKYADTCNAMEKVQPSIASYFQSYYSAFNFPRDCIHTTGKEGAYSFTVYKEHAESLAEGLYKYLIKKSGKAEAKTRR